MARKQFQNERGAGFGYVVLHKGGRSYTREQFSGGRLSNASEKENQTGASEANH